MRASSACRPVTWPWARSRSWPPPTVTAPMVIDLAVTPTSVLPLPWAPPQLGTVVGGIVVDVVVEVEVDDVVVGIVDVVVDVEVGVVVVDVEVGVVVVVVSSESRT